MISVVPNGAHSGKGTHLSVFVFLLQVEFDTQLKWPFRGEIAFKLIIINQEEDKVHVMGPPTSTYNLERVRTARECSEYGWGYIILSPL